MKTNKFLAMIVLAAGFLTACENDTPIEPSFTTFLPTVEVQGEKSVVLPCSEVTYQDAGVLITEGGVELPVTTSIEGKYFQGTEVQGPDEYTITYSSENKDGIPGADTRSVFWKECNGDMVSSISGMYVANTTRLGDFFDDSYAASELAYFFVKDLGDNKYGISDIIGGYYDKGRGYGHHYASAGMVVTANDIAANDFTYGEPVGVGAFGGANSLTAFSVDPDAKTISLSTSWDIYGDQSLVFEWDVELIQVDF